MPSKRYLATGIAEQQMPGDIADKIETYVGMGAPGSGKGGGYLGQVELSGGRALGQVCVFLGCCSDGGLDFQGNRLGDTQVGALRALLQGIALKQIQFDPAQKQRDNKQAIEDEQLEGDASFKYLQHSLPCFQQNQRCSGHTTNLSLRDSSERPANHPTPVEVQISPE